MRKKSHFSSMDMSDLGHGPRRFSLIILALSIDQRSLFIFDRRHSMFDHSRFFKSKISKLFFPKFFFEKLTTWQLISLVVTKRSTEVTSQMTLQFLSPILKRGLSSGLRFAPPELSLFSLQALLTYFGFDIE